MFSPRSGLTRPRNFTVGIMTLNRRLSFPFPATPRTFCRYTIPAGPFFVDGSAHFSTRLSRILCYTGGRKTETVSSVAGSGGCGTVWSCWNFATAIVTASYRVSAWTSTESLPSESVYLTLPLIVRLSVLAGCTTPREPTGRQRKTLRLEISAAS